MRIIFLRLKQMLLGWGTVGIVYSCCDRLQGQGSLLTPWAIDRVIPFSPTAVWLYLSFFLLIPAGYFLVPLMQLRWLTRAMQIAAIGAGSIYLMWPTTMQYPPLIGDGPSSQVLGWLIGVDSPQNCFPSLHAGLTLLTVWAIAVRRQTVITTVSLVWALAIAISILQLRRHLFVDLVGGVLLAGGSGWLAMYIDAGKKQHREIRYE